MTMYIHTVCISPVFFQITKSRNTFDSPGYCKVQSLAMARTSAPDKFSAPVVHYPETESNKNKQIRQRSVPVIVCEKFKQFHGISNLPWKNWFKCFHFLTKHAPLCLLFFKEPLFLHI